MLEVSERLATVTRMGADTTTTDRATLFRSERQAAGEPDFFFLLVEEGNDATSFTGSDFEDLMRDVIRNFVAVEPENVEEAVYWLLALFAEAGHVFEFDELRDLVDEARAAVR